MKNFKIILLFLITSCVPQRFKAEWSTILRANSNIQRYEVLHSLLLNQDSIFSIGTSTDMSPHQDFIMINRQHLNGDFVWSKEIDLGPNDRPWKSFLNRDGFYILTESHFSHFDLQGELLWSIDFRELTPDPLLRDFELSHSFFYIGGRELYKVSFEGEIINIQHPPKPIWDVYIANSKLYTGGNGFVLKLDEQLNKIWSYQVGEDQNPPLELIVDNEGFIYGLSLNNYPQESTTLFALDSQGKKSWQRHISDPDPDSFKLPGFPFLRKMPNNNLLVALSQQPTRQLILFNKEGNILKKQKSKSGIINEIEVDAQGFILLFGESHPELYNQNLQLIATAEFPKGGDITSGALAQNSYHVFIGGSVPELGTMKFMVSSFSKKFK